MSENIKNADNQTDVQHIADGLRALLALIDLLAEPRTVNSGNISVLLALIAVSIESGLPGYVDVRS